jgi:hypothetical protein
MLQVYNFSELIMLLTIFLLPQCSHVNLMSIASLFYHTNQPRLVMLLQNAPPFQIYNPKILLLLILMHLFLALWLTLLLVLTHKLHVPKALLMPIFQVVSLKRHHTLVSPYLCLVPAYSLFVTNVIPLLRILLELK